ncbi:hypothetical protein NST38_31350 [Paenibacillus sp. FSL H8-0104]|uniref:PD-(D/E)XK nuclease domain-containing protein n=1 Tax=Paenibacillus sp. FSL H8-0104 TaxID=2954509 RepID=UPI0030FDE267
MVAKVHFIGVKDEIIQNIQSQIEEGLALQSNGNDMEIKFESWVASTIRMLNQTFSEDSIASEFAIQSMVSKSPGARGAFSGHQVSLNMGIAHLEGLIRDIEKGYFDNVPQEVLRDNTSLYDPITFHRIISSIMLNFMKHVEEMYQKPVHGNGGLKKEDLDKVALVNEYDVQRMLFSLIRPIFPDARLEADQDAGYKGIRYDIYLGSYDTVIEVKCTRKTMRERDLSEEIGSDVFHYPHKNVYFFIYDKTKLVTNVDAFTKRYSTPHDGKNIKTIIIQPLVM